ncbi:MAG: Spy/CpxP family protein refolding chaperone [Acidobacteria bacterium]|nr:Spy/CpxP family protein refolding chaperone [Acidobacteriota bacterium]
MRQKLFRTFALAGVFALLAGAGLAQQQPPAQTQGQKDGPPVVGRMGRRMGREGRGGGGREGVERRVLGRLNLSDAQREQLRGIESRYAEGFRTKRGELRGILEARRGGGTLTAEQQARARQLRDELRASSGKMREEIRALLTDEQRARLQSTRDELRQGHEARRGMREERREKRRAERGERRRQRRQQTPAPPNGDDRL